MKTIFNILMLLLIVTTAFPQSGWVEQTVSNAYGGLNDIYFINKDMGWIIGEYGNIFHTTNGGENWISQKLSSGYYSYYAIHFVDAQKGWAVGNGGSLITTTNGGKSWDRRQLYSSDACFNDIYFTDANHGFLVGGKSQDPRSSPLFARTVDKGQTWQFIKPDTSLSGSMFCIAFSDSNNGFAGGYGKIYRTTDAGASWRYFDRLIAAIGQSIEFSNDNNGIIVGSSYSTYYGYVLYSTNGGNSWWSTLQIPMYLAKLYSVSFVSNQVTTAVGDSGVIIRSMDGGKSWVRQQFDYNLKLRCVEFVDNNVGWIVSTEDGDGGLVGRVFKTTTGGEVMGISDKINWTNQLLLRQNYPNPFNPTTTISYSLPTTQLVNLEIYNLLGNKVATLVNEKKSPGDYQVVWQADQYSSGLYFYRLATGDLTLVRKMVLLK